jgi:hypothetical protein
MVDASPVRSRDPIETSRDLESSQKKRQRSQQADLHRPASVHGHGDFAERTSGSGKKESSVEKLSPVAHKEVYYMEEILKEETGGLQSGDGVQDFHEEEEEEEEEEARGHDDVRFSPEKEQALQTLDEVIQAAEESMSKSHTR